MADLDPARWATSSSITGRRCLTPALRGWSRSCAGPASVAMSLSHATLTVGHEHELRLDASSTSVHARGFAVVPSPIGALSTGWRRPARTCRRSPRRLSSPSPHST